MEMHEYDENRLEKPPHEEPPYIDLEVGPGMSVDNRRFGELLARIREHAGLSRAEAAATLGVSAEYLRLIELGRRTPALGQMRSFLDAYRANGDVGRLQPGGDRPDLIVMDPINDEPVIVEFKSRIREARRSTSNLEGGVARRKNIDFLESVCVGPSASHAADLGIVVSLLAHVDGKTIRKVRDWLQGEAGSAGNIVWMHSESPQ